MNPPPVLADSPSSSDSALFILQVTVRLAAVQVDIDCNGAASSNAPLVPTSHRVSIPKRPDVVFIASSHTTSPTPRTPTLGSAAQAEMVDQLYLPESEDLDKVRAAREQALVKSRVCRLSQRECPSAMSPVGFVGAVIVVGRCLA